jgi:hypothetical protein
MYMIFIQHELISTYKKNYLIFSKQKKKYSLNKKILESYIL